MVSTSAWIRVARTEALTAQKGRCLYCKAPLRCGEATADHKRPKKRGGTNAKENIAAACFSCNQIKGHIWESKFWKVIDGKKPPKKPELMIVWASRRIWKRANKACERIERSVALASN